MTLQYAIATEEPLPNDQLEQIRSYKICLIGTWLDSPATFCMRSTIEYLDLVRKHIDFHRQMEHVASLLERREFLSAALAMSTNSSFDKASQAIALAIMALDRIVPIQVSQHAASPSAATYGAEGVAKLRV